MMNFLRKYQYQITIGLAAVMIFYIFMGLGAGFFHSGPNVGSSIAEVNGEEIPLQAFYSHYRQALNRVEPGKTLDDAARRQRRDETIPRHGAKSVIFAKEAERYGIQVPDRQVAMSLAQTPAFRKKDNSVRACTCRRFNLKLVCLPGILKKSSESRLPFLNSAG